MIDCLHTNTARLLRHARSFAEYDKEKDEEAIKAIHAKCANLVKKGGDECGGAAAVDLHKKLKKKYGKGPKVDKRFKDDAKKTAEDGDSADNAGSTSGKQQQQQQQQQRRKTTEAAKPNLHLATTEDILAELEKREEAEREKREEEEDDDDDDEDLNLWTPSDFPERVTVIGGGPAGMSAAIYAARAGLTPVIVAPPMGGQLQGKGVDVENYPGLANMTGPGIVAAMREQAVQFGTLFQAEEAISVDVSSRPYRVTTNTTTIETHSIIVATGAESKWLGVPGEYDLRGGGVSSCATCDGFLFKDQDVVVVGGGGEQRNLI